MPTEFMFLLLGFLFGFLVALILILFDIITND